MSQPRYFVDSNLWLYSLISNPPQEDQQKHFQAIALINQFTPIVSTQIINEVCSVLRRKAAYQEPQLRRLVQVFQERCVVTQLSCETLIQASDLRSRYGFSFWDGLIVASAVAAGADILYSEDMQHGLNIEQTLRIENPFLSQI